MRKLLIAAALLAVPGLASAQMLTGRQYVTKAGASDQYEIQSSRLILNSTRNPDLRSYAQDMIRDHQASTADVKRAAMRAHVMAGPPHLDAMGARNSTAPAAPRATRSTSSSRSRATRWRSTCSRTTPATGASCR